MNINYYEFYYTFNMNRYDKKLVNENEYENDIDYIHYIDFILPKR